MIFVLDFESIEKYKENNRIEAKKALGGLPKSIWETYSSFANTLGGVILLGVEEYRDKSLHTVDLPDPYGMVKEFLEGLNDPKKVNVNILSCSDVSVVRFGNNRIIVIEVPRARRFEKPVYINGDMAGGTYRRNGEGDYRCTAEEISAMIRDSAAVTEDLKPLLDKGLGFDEESVSRFRKSLIEKRKSFCGMDERVLLEKIGALAEGDGGEIFPTAAGILMLGDHISITKAFPEFYLSCRVEKEDGTVTFSKGRGENMFDFCAEVINEFEELADSIYCDSERVTGALSEALVNGLANVDYHLGGVTVSICREGVRITNSGGFRVKMEKAERGEISDSRNAGVASMFSLVNLARGTGGGIARIYSAWHSMGWSLPEIRETFSPEKTTIELPLGKFDDTDAVFHEKSVFRYSVYKEETIYYLTRNISGDLFEIARYAEAGTAEISEILSELLNEGIICEEKEEGKTRYKLRA